MMGRDPTTAELAAARFAVATLGAAVHPNPVAGHASSGFVSDEERVLYDVEVGPARTPRNDMSFEKAGIRARIFFEPSHVHAAIVTCGGLCPGLNDVIRTVVHQLHYRYGVRRISGIPYGYRGLNPAYGLEPIALTPDVVRDIQDEAGTILGSSRGNQPDAIMLDTLVRLGVNILFAIGGDGTQRGAHEIHELARARGIPLAVIGVPKTIDNDIAFVYKTFGFDTAVEVAQRAIDGAHAEAVAFPRGVSIVKLMGRDSGFIAAHATLASGNANFTLVPEIPFRLEGPNGFLAHLERRLEARDHAVIVVAEGAGQDQFDLPDPGAPTDQPHNRIHRDIGLLLRDRVREYFDRRKAPVSLKYIDPGYMVRNTPANAADSLFCMNLGRAAVHAGMAGKTDMLVGLWYNILVHVPIPLAISRRKQISPASALWFAVLEATGQPHRMI